MEMEGKKLERMELKMEGKELEMEEKESEMEGTKSEMEIKIGRNWKGRNRKWN